MANFALGTTTNFLVGLTSLVIAISFARPTEATVVDATDFARPSEVRVVAIATNFPTPLKATLVVAIGFTGPVIALVVILAESHEGAGVVQLMDYGALISGIETSQVSCPIQN